MPLIQPDTSEAGALQPGTYLGKILSADPGTAKSGNPKIVVKVEMDVAGKAKTRTDNIPTTGGGAFKFDQLLRAAGFSQLADAYRTPGANKPAFNTDDLVGIEVNCVVENDMYEGNLTDKISKYLPK